MESSSLSEWVLAEIRREPRTARERMVRKVAVRLRPVLAARSALVRYELAGRKTLLPVDHDLPLILDRHRFYAGNLVRLIQMIKERESDLLVVDIGANVGDTAIMIRQSVDCPILCIEGDSEYWTLLCHNTAAIDGITAVKAFVSFEGSEDLTFAVDRAAGTARLSKNTAGAPGITTVPLAELLHQQAQGRRPRLVKIDTDGYDPRILLANQELIYSHRPVLFLEFDPKLMLATGDRDPLRALALLNDLGYERALVYQNTGEPLGVANLSSWGYWSDLANCLLLGPPGHYVDIAVYHADDGQLAGATIDAERHFFASQAGLLTR